MKRQKRTRTPRRERFWKHVTRGHIDDCWLWQGQRGPKGYGRLETWDPPPGVQRMQQAHRASFEFAYGYLPEWPMVIDHRCNNKLCVNPFHLAILSAVENSMRGGTCLGAINIKKTHCPQGHEYTPENIRRVPSNPGARYCRICHRIETTLSSRIRRAALKANKRERRLKR